LDIVAGGTDTTSFLLSIGMHLLAHHPEYADRIRNEVTTVLKVMKSSVDSNK